MKAKDLTNKLMDPVWRLSNLYYITDKQGRKVLFKPNDCQKQLMAEMHTNNVILKARQLGMTTFIQLYMLDKCLFKSNLRCGVIAHNRNDAQVFFRDKIKFAYDNLPDWLKSQRECYNDSATELRLSNNSSIRVGTSMRSGTVQILHVSEFGKICAQYPLKAKEIITGALNSVQAGQQIFIESTAEGTSGYFYDICQQAMLNQRKGKQLEQSDFKFHFFPWHLDASYATRITSPSQTVYTPELDKYFNDLEHDHDIILTPQQKAWYAAKDKLLHDDIKREYPTTPDEAFAENIEGAYYLKWINEIETKGQVTNVPYNPDYPVNTYWDLGIDDATAIWFVQKVVGGSFAVIDYFEACDQSLSYYINLLKEKKYIYGTHYAPHDIEVRELSSAVSRKMIARSMGIEFTACPQTSVADGINAVRSILSRCYFDDRNTDLGLRSLKNYRRKWDSARGKYDDKPYHDWASHGADAFRLFAMAEGRKSITEEKQTNRGQQRRYTDNYNDGGSPLWI